MNTALDQLLGRRDLWRGGHRLREQPAIASEHAALDALLPGGGWPLGALTEICSAHPGMGEVSLLLPALARLQRDAHWIAWIAPPHAPYAPALRQAGIDPSRCLLVEKAKPAARNMVSAVSPRALFAKSGVRGNGVAAQAMMRKPGSHFTSRGDHTLTPLLWSAEQLLRGGSCAAVMLWWDGEDNNALRRLQLAAEATGALSVLFRPAAAAARLSPAALRLRVEAGNEIQIMKCRGADLRAARGQRLRLLARQPWWTQGEGVDAGLRADSMVAVGAAENVDVARGPALHCATRLQASPVPRHHASSTGKDFTVIPSAAKNLALSTRNKIPCSVREDMVTTRGGKAIAAHEKVVAVDKRAKIQGSRARSCANQPLLWSEKKIVGNNTTTASPVHRAAIHTASAHTVSVDCVTPNVHRVVVRRERERRS